MTKTTYHELNAQVNFYDADGNMQLGKDKEAAKAYFLEHVNPKTRFFYTLRERIDYLIENKYYDEELIGKYSFDFIKYLTKEIYAYRHRFKSFLGALKFFTAYALKSFNGEEYLERYEDRVVMVALLMADGSEPLACQIAEEIITGRLQPATPTFSNAGKKQRGEYASCFLMDTADNMESIGRTVTNALQLSKRGGGVAINLSNLREEGAPIKNIENQASGVIPVMKILEDSFSYANQLGQRNGAGLVSLSVHHPDILKFIDSKRENASDAVRIKTLSLSVVVTDIAFQLARNNEDLYMFSPYDIERIYGKPFSYVNITEEYRNLVDNPEIRKKKMSARGFFTQLSEVLMESGYPFLMFEDNVNRAHSVEGKVILSNLCHEIAQVTTPPEVNEDLSYADPGRGIQCNLGSLNVANVMSAASLGSTVGTSVRALTNVSDLTQMTSAPPIQNGNDKSHAIGLGQMNLHGYLASVGIPYDSPEAVDFTSVYFMTVAYHAISASCSIAEERGETFYGFENSDYADGMYFDKYTTRDWGPTTEHVKAIFANKFVPTPEDWLDLSVRVAEYGMYNAYLQAVPPTGSISYLNHATASIHPVTAPVEIRKEGKIGRVYFPAPGMTQENIDLFKDAYELGYKAVIDVYAAAQEHVDQGLSMTLFFKDDATTRDLNKAQIYAWSKGIKTIYYSRIRQIALEGTEMVGCVSCAL